MTYSHLRLPLEELGSDDLMHRQLKGMKRKEAEQCLWEYIRRLRREIHRYRLTNGDLRDALDHANSQLPNFKPNNK